MDSVSSSETAKSHDLSPKIKKINDISINSDLKSKQKFINGTLYTLMIV